MASEVMVGGAWAILMMCSELECVVVDDYDPTNDELINMASTNDPFERGLLPHLNGGMGNEMIPPKKRGRPCSRRECK